MAVLEPDQRPQSAGSLGGLALVGSGVFGVFLRRFHPDQYCADPAVFVHAPDGGEGAPGAAAGRGDRAGRVRGVPVPAGDQCDWVTPSLFLPLIEGKDTCVSKCKGIIKELSENFLSLTERYNLDILSKNYEGTMDGKDNIPRKFREELIESARAMRKSPTHAELLMWRELREGQLRGYKFRRQHIIKTFIIDFYCPEAKLVIEIDGSVHRNQVEYDQIRENDLNEMGYEVLRFRNEEVVNEINLVLESIEEKLSQLSDKSM